MIANETSPASANGLPEKLPMLPEAWIDRIFTGMEAIYGSLFLDRWKDTDLRKVKLVWAETLASFSDHPQCFGLALKALITESKFPPTLPEFVAICRKNYQRPMPIMLEHKLTPEDIARNRARLRDIADGLAKKLSAPPERAA